MEEAQRLLQGLRQSLTAQECARKLQDIIERIIETPEHVLYDLVDFILSPKIILRQLVLIVGLQTLIMTSIQINKFFRNVIRNFTASGREIKRIYSLMDKAKTYSEWLKHAEHIDVIRGNDKWRSEDQSMFYDAKIIRQRIADTNAMMRHGDIFNLMFRLRGGLSRDQFGIQHEGLFTKAFAGTKRLVERYHDTVSQALNFICNSPISDEEIPTDAKLAFFNETRHAYGRTAILLSGGACLGYYHIGVMKVLLKEGLLPRIISGASAGSIMAGVIGTRTDEEFLELCQDDYVAFTPRFFKFTNNLKSPTARWLNYYTPSFLRWLVNPLLALVFDGKVINLESEHFNNELKELLGNYTFQEAFDKTGRIINITVAPLNKYDPPRLLNYLTAPHVCVWSAAAASSALPGVFDSSPLIVKEPNGNYSPENIWTRKGHNESETPPQCYSDGSIESDLPMEQLAELFNVNHFIVIQVNPHSALLSSLTLQDSVWSPPLYGVIVSYIRFLKNQSRDWVKNVLNFLVSRSVGPSWGIKRGLSQSLVQEYEGKAEDITIFPWFGDISVLQAVQSLLKDITQEEYLRVMLASAHAVWPVLARIRAQCMVEITLDKCVQSLRQRVANENEALTQKNHPTTVHHGNKSGFRDRVPSFYTSRSIVNLSGLSVSDPIPLFPSDKSISDPPSLERGYSLAGSTIDESPRIEDLSCDNSSVNNGDLTPSDTTSTDTTLGIKKTTSMAKFYYRNDESNTHTTHT